MSIYYARLGNVSSKEITPRGSVRGGKHRAGGIYGSDQREYVECGGEGRGPLKRVGLAGSLQG